MPQPVNFLWHDLSWGGSCCRARSAACKGIPFPKINADCEILKQTQIECTHRPKSTTIEFKDVSTEPISFTSCAMSFRESCCPQGNDFYERLTRILNERPNNDHHGRGSVIARREIGAPGWRSNVRAEMKSAQNKNGNMKQNKKDVNMKLK